MQWEKKLLCFRSILSISLKFQNDHPLALYDNKRLFDAKLDFRKTVVVGSAHSLQIRADQKSPR